MTKKSIIEVLSSTGGSYQRKTNTIFSYLYVESNEQNKLMNKIETEAWIQRTD